MNKFDPYHKWLGIPPDEQPPNHYRLLGIRVFESDPDVISSAAEQRIVFLRSFQKDETVEIAQNLLNEVSAAMVCLLKPKDKAQYDQTLHDATTATQEVPSPVEMFSEFSVEPAGSAVGGRSHPRHRRNTPQLWQRPWMLALVGGGLAIILLAFVMSRGDKSQVANKQNENTTAPPIQAEQEQRDADQSQQAKQEIEKREAVNRVQAQKEAAKQVQAEQEKAQQEAAKRKQAQEAAAKATEANTPPLKEVTNPFTETDTKVVARTINKATFSLSGHRDSVQSVSFSPDGKRLASGSWDGTVRIWDIATGQEALAPMTHSAAVDSVAFSANGTLFASAANNTIQVWDAFTGNKLHTLTGHRDGLYSISFSPDATRLVSAAANESTIRVWDTLKGQTIFTLSGHAGEVYGVAYSPDGKQIASASRDATIKVWDAETGQELMTLKGHSDRVWTVAFSPDSKRLASGSSDNTLKIWDAANGQELLTLEGHTELVRRIAFNPDGQYLASASSDKTVKVWNATSGQELLTLKEHTRVVKSVAFSPDGKRIASASGDQTVKIWDLEIPQGTSPFVSRRPAKDAPSIAVSPFDLTKARQHQQAWAKYLKVPVAFTNSIGMRFTLIPPGEFMMGSLPSEPGHGRLPGSTEKVDESLHPVRISKPFYFGEHEVTQNHYSNIMSSNPSRFKFDDHPVECVTWNEASSFAQKLSTLSVEKQNGNLYRLPTEAEWEFACRAGTTTAFYSGNDISQLANHAWFPENSNRTTHPVGQKQANPWGLFDIHGNVMEWCGDWVGPYPREMVNDPQGPTTGTGKVHRDGSGWYLSAESCRSGQRTAYSPTRRSRIGHIGFRIVLEIPGADLAKEQTHLAIVANPTTQNELRFAIPDKTAQAGAKTKAVDLYESKYQKPLTLKKLENAPASKVLAQEILPLHFVANDSATKFILLEMALQRATESGDSALTWQIIDDLSKVFTVDGLTYRVHAITTWSDVITRRYRGPDLVEARLELLRVILLLIYQAESGCRFEQLEELYRLAGRQVTDDSRRQRAYKNLSLSVKPKAARHEEMMTLVEQDGVIDDSKTQVQLGSYWCFELRDWPKGLAHLIQGSDELLKKNAQLELAGGNSVEEQMKIADTWWNYAKQLPRSKTEAVESHAAMWYQRALPQLPADEKTRIQKLLSGLTKAHSSQTQYLTSLPPSEIRMFMSDELAPDYLQLKWHIFKVNENEILNGIWLHPPGGGSSGHIAFHLRRKFHGLSGTAVCLRNANSALTFRVVGDGNVLWTSTPLQRKETFQNFQVNVSGIDKLELFIDCPGSHIEAHAAWADPVLTR